MGTFPATAIVWSVTKFLYFFISHFQPIIMVYYYIAIWPSPLNERMNEWKFSIHYPKYWAKKKKAIKSS